MKDYVTFLIDVKDGEEIIFNRNCKYEVLDENNDSYFIQIAPKTNQVTQFPKSLKGEWFIF